MKIKEAFALAMLDLLDVYDELLSYSINVDVLDPWANNNEVKENFGFELIEKIIKKYHSIILAVSHKEFLSIDLPSHLVQDGLLYDVKGVLDICESSVFRL